MKWPICPVYVKSDISFSIHIQHLALSSTGLVNMQSMIEMSNFMSTGHMGGNFIFKPCDFSFSCSKLMQEKAHLTCTFMHFNLGLESPPL